VQKKREKDAYPKKVCHMPTRHVKKMEKDAPKKVCHMPTRNDPQGMTREREREDETRKR